MNEPINTFSQTRQRGMSLVELMIAMLLGLIIIGGSIQVFVSSKVTYNVADGLARLQENARYSLDLINREVRMIGAGAFCGGVPTTFAQQDNAGNCTFPPDSDGHIQICSLLDPSAAAMINGGGLAVFESSGTASGNVTHSIQAPGTGSWTPTLPAPLQGRVLPGTDVLGLAFTGLAAPNLTICSGPNPPTSASLNTCDLDGNGASPPNDTVNQTVMVVDCAQRAGDTFVNMRNSGGGGGGGNQGRVVNRNRQGSGFSTSYQPGTQIYRVTTAYYYVGESSATAGDATQVRPALFRAELDSGAGTWRHDELAEGIDNVQMFVRTEASPNWVAAPGPTGNVGDVTALRINLMASSPEPVEGRELAIDYPMDDGMTMSVNDRRVRQVYTNTVAIRERTRPVD